MPFTVSCTACATRFLLGDDLFRRKVSGNVVTVKCRNCNAEISVDARDVDTMPSQEPPRRAPAPPRPHAPPRHKDKTAVVVDKPISDEARSIWDSSSEQTVSIAGKLAAGQEPEFVDFEEIPASSSDAPALNTLTHESAARVHPPRRNRPPDEFLVNLSAGTGGILGAPTIDVSGLGAPPPPSIEELDIEPEELSTQRTGTVPLLKQGGTIPLFDMSAVLPAANPNATQGSSSSAPMQIDIDVGPLREKAPLSAGKVRERKNVVAPQDAPRELKSRRGGALVWFGVAAVAAGVLAVVGLRGHRTPQPVASEPQPGAEHSAVLSIAAPSVDSIPTAAPVAEASAAPETVSDAPSIAAPSNAAAATPATTTPTTNVAVKSAVTAKAEPTEPPAPPKAEAAIATEKPAAPVAPATPTAPVEIHNALPPAAPGTEFDRSAAVSALKGAAAQASSCRKDGDPSGTATLVITFAPSGRVTSATIEGPPFAGTATGGCIASTMRHAQIPSFDGDRVTVTKTVVIE
ncbi:MAG TPA: hypothetical protein VHW01_29465 [Polyangiaceae bacterium]|jgi:hypothetical protein|nr:hypothetical protein [Polyangiaceae bacterium]